ncbi:MAG TPA: hypothetical protein VHD15_15305 [Hyphomicrobiales bacterium]|nr:hypothetical protein [Hyphomicrobiales bacterium]
MTATVAIAGTGMRVGRAIGPIEDAVRAAVRDALAGAGMTSPDGVDMIVTVGSDILDGAMVATRSGIAGAYGRELMTVPSSAGHAFAAAVALIESGQANRVLLVGWGEGTKFGVRDGRTIQADPFYARPLGATPAVLATLQAQRLAGRAIDVEAAAGYGAAMRARAGLPPLSGPAGWLVPGWCDGAAALVLAAGSAGVAVADFATIFHPYCPEPDELDPARWVEEATGRLRRPEALRAPLGAIEVGAPTPFCEAAAVRDLLAGQGWTVGDSRLNPSGGGAVAHFGPATGLARIVSVADAIGGSGHGAALDLAGPVGQATTVIVLGGATVLQ